MFVIKTQAGELINADYIEGFCIMDDVLRGITPRCGYNGDFDVYEFYRDNNKEHLEEALRRLFTAMTMIGCGGFDFSLIRWEDDDGKSD